MGVFSEIIAHCEACDEPHHIQSKVDGGCFRWELWYDIPNEVMEEVGGTSWVCECGVTNTVRLRNIPTLVVECEL